MLVSRCLLMLRSRSSASLLLLVQRTGSSKGVWGSSPSREPTNKLAQVAPLGFCAFPQPDLLLCISGCFSRENTYGEALSIFRLFLSIVFAVLCTAWVSRVHKWSLEHLNSLFLRGVLETVSDSPVSEDFSHACQCSDLKAAVLKKCSQIRMTH